MSIKHFVFLTAFCVSLFSQTTLFRSGNLSVTNNDNVQAIKVSSTGTILAGSWNIGMFRTTNNGDNWTLAGLNGSKIYYFEEGQNGSLFAFTHTISGPVIFRSTDDGITWNQVYMLSVSNNYFYGGSMVSAGGGILVAGVSYTRGPTLSDIGVDILRSTNNGAVWTNLGTIIQWGGTHSFARLSDGRILAATSISGIWQSTNNGSFWTQLTTFPPVY